MQKIIAILTGLALSACGGNSSSDLNLVGGSQTTDGTETSVEDLSFPASIHIKGDSKKRHCTGAIIKPNLPEAEVANLTFILTAGHCVVGSSKRITSDYNPGALLNIDTARKWQEGVWSHELEIVRTFVHHSYHYGHSYESRDDGAYKGIAADVALIVVKKPEIALPEGVELAESAVILNSQQSAPRIVKGGYGCESLNKDEQEESYKFRYKAELTTLPDPDEALAKAVNYQSWSFKEVIGDFYHVTRGAFYDNPGEGPPYDINRTNPDSQDQSASEPVKPNHSSLCYVDSGGPLYAETADGIKVAGVNSQTRATYDPEIERSVIDIHTRVDHDSALLVGEWIGSIIEKNTTDQITTFEQGIHYTFDLPRFYENGPKETETSKVKFYLKEKSSRFRVAISGGGGKCNLALHNVAITDSLSRATINLEKTELAGVYKTPGQQIVKAKDVTYTLEAQGEEDAKLCFISLYATPLD